jgi:hypothetical protein
VQLKLFPPLRPIIVTSLFKFWLSAAKMGTKRSADDMEQTQPRPRRENPKRARLASIEDANSSDPSSCSVSVDSALQSSPPISAHTRESSLSSLQPPNRDDDSEESLSSSTSEGTSNSESDDLIITIGGPTKPEISSSLFSDGAEDLRARLSTLLPELAEANKMLKDGPNVYSMEDVEEDEQHIEMDLGLGVLEEKRDESSSSLSEDSSDFEDELEGNGDVPASSRSETRTKESKASDVMSDLLGQQNLRQKAGIEDLG